MKRTLMIGLLVLLTISVGMLISCSGEVKVDKSTEFIKYMMKDGDWFENLKTLNPDLKKTSITSISFVKEKPEGIPSTITGTDLTIEENGKVMGYVSGTDIYIVGDKIVANYDSSYMFGSEFDFIDCYKNLTKLDLSNLDTSKVKNMSYMFMYCTSLTDIYFGDFNTSKVTNMKSMFSHCSSLKKLDLSSWDTSNVESMNYMFCECTSLTDLTLCGKFNTSNATEMIMMFFKCPNLQKLDLSSFDTSKVTNMGAMFCKCSSLKELDLSNFDTSNVEVTCGAGYGMFDSCSSLESITFSEKFKTFRVITMECMFNNCTSLTDLNLTSFDITTTGTDLRANRPNTDSMFDWWTSGHSVKVATSQVGDGTYGWSIQNNLTGWTSSTDVSGLVTTYTRP